MLCCCRLWKQLLQHWGHPVPSLPDPAELEAVRAAATAANLASRVHQADLASRAMLNAALEHVQAVSVWGGGVAGIGGGWGRRCPLNEEAGGGALPLLLDPAELEAVGVAATAANVASKVHRADLASRAMLNAALEYVQVVSE